MSIIVSAIGQGLLWGIVGIGLFLTFRILDFPDMTVEGTFPMGAAACVAAIYQGFSPFTSTLIAFIVGMAAGFVTGILYTKGHIPVLLAGILVMTAAYSINFRIMGRANLSLFGKSSLLKNSFLESLPPYFDSVVLGIAFVVVVTLLIIYFLQTNLGQAFIATGDNPTMARSLGINTDAMQIMGLSVSNGLIALGGALVAQNNGFSDVNMGIGVIVVALASIIIGEVIFGDLTMNERLMAVTIGSILYRFVILIVLKLGFNANDLNLISAIVLAIFMMFPVLEKRFRIRHTLQRGLSNHD
ncbi:MAG: ABC transporter permease [Lentilactobacillus diolivorans]|jgi:putative ABC transport system permease protein|uniref:ABC transporter permease n=1 Tax=Lentilactobacillus diolivorans TaxID=179838 RepID=UPI000FEE921E|nr:ABC transporter permease [Lentilactobacillus diolivorans]MCH4163992.1 ABC transporter permease [Lentilactobacillus diolivorans]MDH5104796.1 ABC transporter permease [Lentilactobacillus diolivorans]RRG02952.1 MAG: ABC transporter permease [Lactobacillus sp.]